MRHAYINYIHTSTYMIYVSFIEMIYVYETRNIWMDDFDRKINLVVKEKY